MFYVLEFFSVISLSRKVNKFTNIEFIHDFLANNYKKHNKLIDRWKVNKLKSYMVGFIVQPHYLKIQTRSSIHKYLNGPSYASSTQTDC